MKKIFLSFILIAVFFFSVPALGQAQIPFGGRIAVSIPCPYSASWLLITIPAAGPTHLVYRPGISQLHLYGQIFRPGPSVLGMTMGADVCVLSIKPPIVIPGHRIGRIGTSL